MTIAPDTQQLMRLAESMMTKGLSGLGAGIVAAAHLDIASDSRSFSRLLGIAHALVLREMTGLSAEGGPLLITARDERTQRTRYALTPAGEEMVRFARAELDGTHAQA